MIISHKHKFIFVKTAKTGGSSIEKILDDCLSSRDIASGTVYKDSDEATPTRQINWRSIGYPQDLGGDSHASASHIYKTFFDGQRPKDYFVFTVERNSYDKAVSHWWWHTQTKRIMKHKPVVEISLDDHLQKFASTQKNNHPSCWPKYTIGDDLCVDMIYQYESMLDMFSDLSQRFDIEIDKNKVKNTRLKDSNKPFSNYREPYTEKAKELVKEIFQKEIDHFGYKF